MNNTTARFPESDTVLGAGSREEVVHLLVNVDGTSEILLATDLRLNQVIAVNRRWDGYLRETRRDELEHRHLGGSVLK